MNIIYILKLSRNVSTFAQPRNPVINEPRFSIQRFFGKDHGPVNSKMWFISGLFRDKSWEELALCESSLTCLMSLQTELKALNIAYLPKANHQMFAVGFQIGLQYGSFGLLQLLRLIESSMKLEKKIFSRRLQFHSCDIENRKFQFGKIL